MSIEALRQRALRAAVAIPAIRFIVVDKDRRVGVQAVLAVLFSAIVAIASPVVVLVASPLLLGIPHLASEATWLRRRISTHFALGSLAFAPAIVACAMAEWTRAEIVVAAVWIATAGRRPAWFVSAALLAGAVAAPTVVRDSVIVLHAFVTFAVWVVLYRAKKRFALPALLLTGVATLVVAVVRDPWVALAFLQSVHYAVWLGLVPQDATRGAGPLTLPMTWRAVQRALGVGGLALLAVLGCALFALTVHVGPTRARDLWLVFSRFHVWLELAVLLAWRRTT